MKINSTFFISMNRKTRSISTNIISGGYVRVYGTEDSEYHGLLKILQACRKRSYEPARKNVLITRWLKTVAPAFSEAEISRRLFPIVTATSVLDDIPPVSAAAPSATSEPVDKSLEFKRLAEEIGSDLLKFFSEFNYTPSFRFANTFIRSKDRASYVTRYFTLQNHTFAREITEKVKSGEFKAIDHKSTKLYQYSKVDSVNSRFSLYYGEPGTGKTTVAITEAEKCVVCSSDMLPVDLMQNFAFTDEGKAAFQKSDLWKAMEDGSTIVLDEVNMLPFESLRFLQGILDNKESIDFKGFHININKNFKVIGTMNLNVNGQCIPLPAPLVDRCSDIVEYEMTPSLLAKALLA